MITKLKHLILINKREIALISVLVILALILRVWRINEFAIFLSDQAIDSYAVKNIIEGNFTLLGPRASVGNFFNGPAIYYLMLPFYFVMKLDPLAGRYFQIFLQLATIPFIFLLGKRIGTDMTGYLSAVLFAISPLFIYYSKAAFNSYPALFLSVLIIYLMTFEKKKMWHFLIAGFATGVLVQAHYLLYVYAFFYFVYVLLQRNLKRTFFYLAGILVGITPFLLFELRHGFFNLNAIFRHLSTSRGENAVLIQKLFQFLTSISQILGYRSVFLGTVLIVVIIFSYFLYCKKQSKINSIYTWSFLALSASLVVYSGTIQSHYLIGIQPVLVLFIAFFVTSLKESRKYIFILSIFLIASTLINVSENYKLPKEQDGFGLLDQRVAVVKIKDELRKIKSDIKWNLTQDLQQDNRAMPIRYLLSLEKNLAQPLSVEDYSSNDYLFLVVKSNKKLSRVNTWEYKSFGSQYKVVNKHEIGNIVTMYLLVKSGKSIKTN